jgi:Rrf2 family protein
MKISTYGRYALRVMLDIALHDDQGPVLRQDIAARQGISAEYIAQIFRRLCRAGLARSMMGPGGGYVLTREKSQITIGNIIRSVEGPIAVVSCVIQSEKFTCDRAAFCATRPIWIKLSNLVESFLDSISLEDLRKQAQQLNQEGDPNCPDLIDTFVGTIPSIQEDDKCFIEKHITKT